MPAHSIHCPAHQAKAQQPSLSPNLYHSSSTLFSWQGGGPYTTLTAVTLSHDGHLLLELTSPQQCCNISLVNLVFSISEICFCLLLLNLHNLPVPLTCCSNDNLSSYSGEKLYRCSHTHPPLHLQAWPRNLGFTLNLREQRFEGLREGTLAAMERG